MDLSKSKNTFLLPFRVKENGNENNHLFDRVLCLNDDYNSAISIFIFSDFYFVTRINLRCDSDLRILAGFGINRFLKGWTVSSSSSTPLCSFELLELCLPSWQSSSPSLFPLFPELERNLVFLARRASSSRPFDRSVTLWFYCIIHDGPGSLASDPLFAIDPGRVASTGSTLRRLLDSVLSLLSLSFLSLYFLFKSRWLIRSSAGGNQMRLRRINERRVSLSRAPGKHLFLCRTILPSREAFFALHLLRRKKGLKRRQTFYSHQAVSQLQ